MQTPTEITRQTLWTCQTFKNLSLSKVNNIKATLRLNQSSSSFLRVCWKLNVQSRMFSAKIPYLVLDWPALTVKRAYLRELSIPTLLSAWLPCKPERLTIYETLYMVQ